MNEMMKWGPSNLPVFTPGTSSPRRLASAARLRLRATAISHPRPLLTLPSAPLLCPSATWHAPSSAGAPAHFRRLPRSPAPVRPIQRRAAVLLAFLVARPTSPAPRPQLELPQRAHAGLAGTQRKEQHQAPPHAAQAPAVRAHGRKPGHDGDERDDVRARDVPAGWARVACRVRACVYAQPVSTRPRPQLAACISASPPPPLPFPPALYAPRRSHARVVQRRQVDCRGGHVNAHQEQRQHGLRAATRQAACVAPVLRPGVHLSSKPKPAARQSACAPAPARTWGAICRMYSCTTTSRTSRLGICSSPYTSVPAWVRTHARRGNLLSHCLRASTDGSASGPRKARVLCCTRPRAGKGTQARRAQHARLGPCFQPHMPMRCMLKHCLHAVG